MDDTGDDDVGIRYGDPHREALEAQLVQTRERRDELARAAAEDANRLRIVRATLDEAVASAWDQVQREHLVGIRWPLIGRALMLELYGSYRWVVLAVIVAVVHFIHPVVGLLIYGIFVGIAHGVSDSKHRGDLLISRAGEHGERRTATFGSSSSRRSTMRSRIR